MAVTVLGTWPFSSTGVQEAGLLLQKGSDICEAITKGIKGDFPNGAYAEITVIEDDPATGPYFVGRGGVPNSIGQYEFDAGIMRGSDCSVGAVASLQGYGSFSPQFPIH